MARITFDLPDATCAMNEELPQGLREACRATAETANLRVLCITGTGNVFYSGGNEIPQDLVGASAEQRLDWVDQHQVADAIAGLEMPVIAAINGDALDHGLELALAADLRIAHSDAHFGFTQLAHGSLPWDGGIQRLTRLVGHGWARDMLLTSRIIDAEQALAIGLVNRVADANQFEQAVEDLIESVIAGGPIAARYAKETVNLGMDLTLEQGLRLETDLNVLLQGTSDREEGLQSFTQRRTPNFSGG